MVVKPQTLIEVDNCKVQDKILVGRFLLARVSVSIAGEKDCWKVGMALSFGVDDSINTLHAAKKEKVPKDQI